MRHKLIGILSLLFSSFLFAVPASAVNLPACAAPDGSTEFVLIAEDFITFEPQQPGSKIINGNVLVTNPTTGFVKVGTNTVINGTVIARKIELPDGGATIAHCVADVIVANTPTAKASCATGYPPLPDVNGDLPFTAFGKAHQSCVEPPLGTLTAFSSFCGPTPVVDNCVIGKPTLTVGVVFPTPAQALAGLTNPLTPGCYGALVLENGAVLPLAPGVFRFNSINMKTGSKLIGPATVNVNRDFITGFGVFINSINLNVAFATTAEVVQFYNNSTLTDVVVNAPFGKCHVHTGTALTDCSEICCKILDIEPITADCAPGEFCACPLGFKFLNPWQLEPPADGPITGNLQDARTCVPCAAGDHPPDFPTCR